MILSWVYIFTLYVVNIRSKNASFLSNKNLSLFVHFLYVISIIMLMVLPIDFILENNNIYCRGIGLNAIYFSAFCMIIIFLGIGIRHAKTRDKRFIPLWIFSCLRRLRRRYMRLHSKRVKSVWHPHCL